LDAVSNMPNLITVSRVAKILNTSEGCVRSQERRGLLPAVKTDSGMRLFDRDVIERIARERADRRAGEAA
jgi:DNA-binding transcriptional MerR regulator